VFDRERRLAAEHPFGHLRLPGVEIECVRQVVASPPDRLVVLVGQLPREQRVHPSTLFDQREEVLPLDRHVPLLDHRPEVIVGDARGGVRGCVEIVDRRREPVEFRVTDDPAIVVDPVKHVLQRGEITRRLQPRPFVDGGSRREPVAVLRD
jgi:hypothetical protein